MNRKHILLEPSECNFGKETDRCPVCDWGLAVCKLCGKAEIELDEDCIQQQPAGSPAVEAAPQEERSDEKILPRR